MVFVDFMVRSGRVAEASPMGASGIWTKNDPT
jgi:hypothetical protein